MYFSHAFRKTLLAAPTSPGGSTLDASSTAATSALTAGQLGLYNQSFGVIDYTSAGTKTPFYLVQGSYYKTTGYSDTIGAHGGYQESVKSKMINPKYITRLFWVQAKAPTQQVVQIPVTCGLTCDTTYRLRIDVKGSPALRYLSHNLYRVLDSYTGCCSTTNPGFVKDPVATIVNWKEQLNASPYFNNMVQARAYKFKGTFIVSGVGTPGVSSATLTFNTSTPNAMGVALGQRIVGSNLPANSLVTAMTTTATATHSATGVTITTTTYTATNSGPTFSGGTPAIGAAITGAGFPVGSYISTYTDTDTFVITFPTQTVAPTISGAFVASASCVVSYPTQAVAPSLATGNYKAYNDVYGPFGNTGVVTSVVGTAVQNSYVGQATYIPGTNTQTNPNGTATGATVGAASTVAAATSGAHVYVADADAASFTADCFLELTSAYVETKFGNATFTVTDNYDVEPLKIIASVMDDSGNPCLTTCIGSSPNIGIAGIATEVQAASQVQGVGETVLRELILTGKYRQEAFGDGVNIDTFRMREIEANPGVLNMMSLANRNALYNKLCILHSVPRFNNPTGVFDNDQYLIEIAVPNTVTIGSFFTNQTTYTAGGTFTATAGSLFGDYIIEASVAAGGAQFVEMI
jgi:hypothetical protein